MRIRNVIFSALLTATSACAQFSYTTFANGLNNVTFNSVNYNYLYGEGLFTLVYEGGSQYTPTCPSNTFTSTSVSGTCSISNGDTFTFTVNYSTPAANTIQANISFVNNSGSNTVTEALFSTIGLSYAVAPKSSSIYGVTIGQPISAIVFGSGAGQAIIWNNTPGDINIGFNQTCGGSGPYYCKNQPQILNVGPGATSHTASFEMMFTTSLSTQYNTLAPQAYAAYASSLPYTVSHPDRRPIELWFTASTSHQSTINPRGYFNQPTLDVSNQTLFNSTAIAQMNGVISSIQAQPSNLQPQGVIIWDIEGEEWLPNVSYIGDPRVFGEGYAPEMDAIADTLFGMLTTAGFATGVTLRPDYLTWNTLSNLPGSCVYNSNVSFNPYYIAVDQPIYQKFYVCQAGGTYALDPTTVASGAQNLYVNNTAGIASVIALLESKINYANSRWGCTIFYIDSAVWDGGAVLQPQIYQALAAAYPTFLFMPEQSNLSTMGNTIPYGAYNDNLNTPYAKTTWRWVYPYGDQATNVGNCAAASSPSGGGCWNTNLAGFIIGQMIGDIPIYSNPGQLSTPQITLINSMLNSSRTMASTITIADPNTLLMYSFTGTPATVYSSYPVTMRVYLASTLGGLATSTTYCGIGIAGANSCSMSLAGLGYAQIKYYDFEGNYVSQGTAGPLPPPTGGTVGGYIEFP